MSKIVICHCNRPDLLKIQIESYFNTCEDLEEIIVVNDGSSIKIRNEIKEISNRTKVRCLEAPLNLDHSSPSVATSAVLQWVYDYLLNSNECGNFAFFDSDLFPLKKFKISDFLKENKSLVGLLQTRGNVEYFWNGLIFVNFNKLPNPRSLDWNCGVINCNSVDSAGQFYFHIKKYGKEHTSNLTHTSHMSLEQINSLINCPKDIAKKYKIDYKIEVFEDAFMHYGRASNWENTWLSSNDFFVEKTKFAIEWLKAVGTIK